MNFPFRTKPRISVELKTHFQKTHSTTDENKNTHFFSFFEWHWNEAREILSLSVLFEWPTRKWNCEPHDYIELHEIRVLVFRLAYDYVVAAKRLQFK